LIPALSGVWVIALVRRRAARRQIDRNADALASTIVERALGRKAS